jgi:hypothetical protein
MLLGALISIFPSPFIDVGLRYNYWFIVTREWVVGENIPNVKHTLLSVGVFSQMRLLFFSI